MLDRPLRICYVLSHFHPRQSGAERQALAQGEELVRRGHSVQVVTRYVPGLAPNETVRGVVVHRSVRTSTRGPLFAVSFVAGVISTLRRLRPTYDLIHTHQGLWESIATGLGRDLFRKAPILIQPASSGYFGEAQEMARTKGFAILRRMSLRNPWFASISAEIESEWKNLGVPPNRIIHMASGVDANHFRPGPSKVEATLPPGPRVVFTGRLHPQKNLDMLLDAWPSVARLTAANLVLVGDGPERLKLIAQAASLGISDRVFFAGSIPDPAEHLRAASVFVLPSVAEGMSNSLLEAMSTALPCLASDIGGNTDLIKTNVTGRLIPPGDQLAWVAAIVDLVSNPEKANGLGIAARSQIEQEFSLPVVVDRYVKLYRQLLDTKIPLEGRLGNL